MLNGTSVVDATSLGPSWNTIHWLGAIAFSLLLFGFDALESILYEHARAPNVSLITQLWLLLGFYALWAVVVRVIWFTIDTNFEKISEKQFGGAIAHLTVTAMALSLCHMAVLAFILRIMYSPPGWGLLDFAHSVSELWIKYAGLWFSMFAAFSLLAFYLLRAKREGADQSPLLTYEVREGARIHSLGITDIFWIEAADNYAQLHTSKGRFLVRKSLTAIEKEAGVFGVIRCHRAALVNMRYAQTIVRDPASGAHAFELNSGQKVPIGRRRVSALRRRLRENKT